MTLPADFPDANTDDEPGRLERSDPKALSTADRKAIKKFGFGQCPVCRKQFIKHRRDHTYCCREHKVEACDRRAGKHHYSADRQRASRHKMKLRLEKIAAGEAELQPSSHEIEVPAAVDTEQRAVTAWGGAERLISAEWRLTCDGQQWILHGVGAAAGRGEAYVTTKTGLARCLREKLGVKGDEPLPAEAAAVLAELPDTFAEFRARHP